MNINERMKAFYEDRFRMHLPRRSNVIIRVDGKAFSTFTSKMKKPYDEDFINDMNETAIHLCKNIQGAKMAYVQSDEISVWLTDYDTIQTDAWFDYNVQKMSSVAASFATAKFNQLRLIRAAESGNITSEQIAQETLAMFDARVLCISTLQEVVNYFLARQQDCTKNAISMAAQTYFSPSSLKSVNSDQKQEMLFTEKGINFNDYPTRFKRGGAVKKIKELYSRKLGERLGNKIENINNLTSDEVYERNKWKIVETPIFSQDVSFIETLILTLKD